MLFSPQIVAARPKLAAAAATPPPITGLIAWYDASVTASLTLSGATITNVADQSGLANHLGDGSTPNRPTYNATGLNSRPAMVFSAASAQTIKTPASTFPMGTGNTMTAFMVATMSSSTHGFGRALSYGTGGSHDYDNNGSWIVARNSSNAQLLFMRTSTELHPTISYDTPYRVIVTIDSGGAMKIYVNGSATSGATQAGNWVSNGYFGLGGGVYDVGANWTGSISEAGIATAFSDATAVAALDSFLQTKWGL